MFRSGNNLGSAVLGNYLSLRWGGFSCGYLTIPTGWAEMRVAYIHPLGAAILTGDGFPNCKELGPDNAGVGSGTELLDAGGKSEQLSSGTGKDAAGWVPRGKCVWHPSGAARRASLISQGTGSSGSRLQGRTAACCAYPRRGQLCAVRIPARCSPRPPEGAAGPQRDHAAERAAELRIAR